MSNIRLNEDMIGKEVRCVYKADCSHPDVGTIGTIVDYDSRDTEISYKVQWPKGTTSRDDRWWAINKCIELVEDNMVNEQEISEMTNEEIWEMLKPKMEKNKLEPMGTCTKWNGCVPEYFYTYSEDDVHNAIALAYRSGYERAMKGRPFKIGEKTEEKKKGGHWEPVDPNNLPKEGTRVRLNKPYDNYYGGIIEAGTVGCVFHDASYGSRVNGYGVSFGEHKIIWFPLNRIIIADCINMWVEDNE